MGIDSIRVNAICLGFNPIIKYQILTVYCVLVIYYVAVYNYTGSLRYYNQVTENGVRPPRIAVNYREDLTDDNEYSKGRSILPTTDPFNSSDDKRMQNERKFSPKMLHNSMFYEVSDSATGVILRLRHHLVASTRKQDFCEVVGEGLHHATTGTIAKLKIENNKTCTRGDELGGNSSFSVLAVGKDHIFSFDPSAIEEGTSDTEFTYTPTYPGTYELFVEDIVFKGQWQVPGSPFQLVVEADARTGKAHKDGLPSCQTLQIPRTNLSWVEGHWLTRVLTRDGQDTLRSGWVYQPKACNFDIFTKNDIAMAAASPVPKTIVVLGSSTERGIFLSLVDLALREGEKRHLKDSDLGKCWGFVEVQLGNLRFIYQDFRVEFSRQVNERDDKRVKITCHDEKKVEEGFKIFDDAMGFLKEFLFSDRVWPDLILMCVRDVSQLRVIFKEIPSSWNGTFYVLSGFKNYRQSLYTHSGRKEEIKMAQQYPSVDRRVQVLDGWTVATGMRHDTEETPMIMGSSHWHRWCNELNGEMRVSGNPTEMVAQILLGKVLAPDGKKSWLKSVDSQDQQRVNSNVFREICVCHDCPESLLPFHIKRVPNLKCYNSTEGLKERVLKNIQVWDGSMCPADCMKTEPTGKIATNSGLVDVRECFALL